MSVGRYTLSRVALGIVTLTLISSITFLATNAVPADPARAALGKYATPEQLAIYREQQGLDRPVVQRYVHWVRDLTRGSWGTSTVTRQDVGSLVGSRLARTLIIGFVAILLAVPLAFVIGVYTGQRSGRAVDVGASTFTLLLNSLPEFVIGIVLLVIFGVELKVLPIESSAVAYGSGLDRVKAYVLPTLTLVLLLTPYLTRMVRVNTRDVLTQPYVRSAVLRGVSPTRLSWRHIAPNASLPVISVIALTLAELIGGVVVVEVVFGFPGIGKLLVDSVLSKDIPTVQAVTLAMGFGFVLLSLVADLVLLGLNPRLRS
jgi:peptide/nickel transport system permease protein